VSHSGGSQLDHFNNNSNVSTFFCLSGTGRSNRIRPDALKLDVLFHSTTALNFHNGKFQSLLVGHLEERQFFCHKFSKFLGFSPLNPTPFLQLEFPETPCAPSNKLNAILAELASGPSCTIVEATLMSRHATT
jgi:hypothetical protein